MPLSVAQYVSMSVGQLSEEFKKKKDLCGDKQSSFK